MEDPVLNRNIEETKELHTRWGQFRDFVIMSMKGQPVTPQAEMKFMELKSRIAMLHDGFMNGLQHDKKTGMNVMNIMSDCILLKRLNNATDAEVQKFEFDWNECFLLLTEQLGTLEDEKKRLAGINERAWKAAKRKQRLEASIHNFLHSPLLKYAGIAAAVFMIVWGIPAFGIYDYREFGKMSWSAKPYFAYVNYVHRPIFDKDFPYESYVEIARDETNKPEEKFQTVKKEDAGSLNFQLFHDVILMQLGLTQADLSAMDDILKKNKYFGSIRYTADGKDVQFYYILLGTTEDAKSLCDKLKSVYSAMTSQQAKNIKDNVFVARKANFVAFGVSPHIMREEFVKQEWKFPKETRNIYE